MIPFKLNNEIYDIPEELVERFKLDNPDALLAEEPGKKQPTPQQGAETVDVTEAPDTGLLSADFSLESPAEKFVGEWASNLKEGFLNNIVGKNTVDKFNNIAYNLFGEDGIGGDAGPSVQAVIDKMASLYATSLKAMQESSLTKKVADAPIRPELGYDVEERAKFIEKVNQKDKELGEKAIQAYSDLLETEKKIKPMPSVIDGSDSLGELIANVAGDATNIGLSVVPALAVGAGTTLVTRNPALGTYAGMAMSNSQLLSYMVTDFNLQKAKSQNPGLTEKEAINKLIKEGELEFDRPAAAALPAMALEAYGFGQISKYLAGKTGLTGSLGGLMWATAGETGTEVLQLIPEGYNLAIASGMNEADAIIDAGEYFAEGAINTALSTAAGTSAFSLLGKAGSGLGRQTWRSMRNMRVAIDENKMETVIDEIADLKIKQYNATDPAIKEAIEEQIKTKNAELSGLVTKSASVFNFAEDTDFDSIDDLEAVKKEYIKKVKELHEKKNDIDVNEYQEALNIYKGKYLEAQNRIKGVVSNISEKANKSAQQVEQIYQEKGKEGEAEILELYRPMAEKIADKYRNIPGFDKQLLSDEILTGKRGIFDLIRSYRPEENPGVPIAAYVNKFARTRAIEAANRVLDTEFTVDVTEAKKVTAAETADSTIQVQEETKQKVKTALAEDLNLDKQTQNEVIVAVEKTLGTKLPEVTDKKFKQALTKSFRNELTNTFKKSFGRTAAYESFLRNNFEKIYSAIPQETINKKFKEFNEPVIDSKTGKQKREKTAEGKKIFKKRDIAKAEFIKYFTGSDVPGNIKGARKNSLAEVLADEIGLDNVLSTLAKSEVLEKFKAVQELQGQKLPENFFEIISEKIDRAIEYLDGLRKGDVLYSSLIIPELSISATKAFLQGVKSALKAGNSFAKALQKGIKAAQELFRNDSEKKIVEDVIKNNIKSEQDLTNEIVEKITIEIDKRTLAERVPNAVNTLIENLKETYESSSDAEIIKNVTDFIVLYSRATRTAASSFKGSSIATMSTTKELLESLDIPKRLYGPKGFAIKSRSIVFNGEKLIKTIDLTTKSRIKLIENPDSLIDQLNDQADFYNKALVSELIRLKNIDKNLAKDALKLWQGDQRSPFRLAAKVGIVFSPFKNFDKKGMLINEHNPPIQHIASIANDFIDGKVSLNTLKKELNNSRQNLVSKEFDNLIPNEFKDKASLDRYNVPLGKNFNFKEFNLNKKQKEKSLSREFNEVLEKSTGVEWYKTYSPVKARLVGKGKGRKFFIPYSADDFVGLLYATLGKGKVGDQQMAWYEENLLRPFSRGIQRYEAAKQKAMRDWAILKKEASKSVPGGLNKTNDSGFTNQSSVRIYIWSKQGMEIPNMSKQDLNENLKVIRNNPKLKEFADRLIALNPDGYPEPSNNWDSGDITTDLVSYINDVRRGEFLTEWKENVEQIFSNENKDKLRALYGDRYVEALDDMLHRMRTGRNRKIGTSKVERVFMDWTNNSVGAIMFFNARSAVLQTLSSINFINFSDNNPINAGLAFANQKQYWKDFATLFNSDFLKQRRTGLQTDINADEIANAAATSENKAKAALSAILKFGFTPTQIADSFAIASGGATMYRNRIKKYLKEGLDQEAAEKRAFTDFQEIAEETQQSARPDRISMQQASSLGRLILAFGNTPMQYARLTKKATLDLVNGRGDWKTNISKIAYYSVIQNIIFSALQQGLFALLFDEEDDDKEKERYFRIGNSSIDTLLRGTGVYGAAAATVKNMIMEIVDQSKKSRPDYTQVAIEATQISPPINSKLRKLESAGKTFTYKQSREKVFTEGFSLENPAFLAAGRVISAGTNLPADRIVQKADHIYTAMQPEAELWQALALSLGWSEWDLGMIKKQTKKSPKPKPKSTFKTSNYKKSFKTKKFKTK